MFKRGFWESFQMFILKSIARKINYYFFKSKLLMPNLIFLSWAMATSIKSASRRYNAQVEADGIMKSVTGWGSIFFDNIFTFCYYYWGRGICGRLKKKKTTNCFQLLSTKAIVYISLPLNHLKFLLK